MKEIRLLNRRDKETSPHTHSRVKFEKNQRENSKEDQMEQTT